MFLFICGILIVVFGGYILISLIQLVFMIVGWIIQAIFSFSSRKSIKTSLKQILQGLIFLFQKNRVNFARQLKTLKI